MNPIIPVTREVYERTNTIPSYTYEKYLLWVKNCNIARRAVDTKRRKYTTWPTRRRDHKLKH